MSLVRYTCVDCANVSPETDPKYSLIGLSGWRSQEVEQGGQSITEWRCPTCWARFKRKTMARTMTQLPSFDSLRGKQPGGNRGNDK
jgi:hypothetical protein